MADEKLNRFLDTKLASFDAVASQNATLTFFQPSTGVTSITIIGSDEKSIYWIREDGTEGWDAERFATQGEAAIEALRCIAKPYVRGR